MNSQRALKLALLFTALCAAVVSSGCDPEKAVNEYFAKLGLNRLAVARSDVEPGALILVGKQGAFYADNMFDYLEEESKNEYGVLVGDKISEFRAVLRRYEGEKTMTAALAAGFLKDLLGLKAEADLKLNHNRKVRIEMINAKVRRMKIPTIRRFLGRNESRPFRNAVLEFMQDGDRAFLGYEVYRTNKLKIATEGGAEISSTLKIGEVHPLVSEADASFSYVRTSTTEVEIRGAQYYVFAMRTAKFERGQSKGTLTLRFTGFLKPKEWGIKSAGTDDEYSAPIMKDYGAVTLLARTTGLRSN